MALFEMVQTLILRFANMEKWINSLNLSTLIFRTLQYRNAGMNLELVFTIDLVSILDKFESTYLQQKVKFTV